MSFFLDPILHKLGADHPERVSIAIAHESFEAAAKLAFVAENLATASTKTVVLAGAGPVLQRTGRGFDSLHDHLESCAYLVG